MVRETYSGSDYPTSTYTLDGKPLEPIVFHDDNEGDPHYFALLAHMWDLHCRKRRGYSGTDPDTWANFRRAERFGVSAFRGVLVRLSDKWSRLENIVADPANDKMDGSIIGAEPEDVLRTLIDIAAYALIAYCIADEERPHRDPLSKPAGWGQSTKR